LTTKKRVYRKNTASASRFPSLILSLSKDEALENLILRLSKDNGQTGFGAWRGQGASGGSNSGVASFLPKKVSPDDGLALAPFGFQQGGRALQAGEGNPATRPTTA
jgi:hypothetical protein